MSIHQGENLRTLMRVRGLSVEKLSKMIKKARGTIYNWTELEVIPKDSRLLLKDIGIDVTQPVLAPGLVNSPFNQSVNQNNNQSVGSNGNSDLESCKKQLQLMEQLLIEKDKRIALLEKNS